MMKLKDQISDDIEDKDTIVAGLTSKNLDAFYELRSTKQGGREIYWFPFLVGDNTYCMYVGGDVHDKIQEESHLPDMWR